MQKKKILIHNMTFEGIHVVPGVINYDQRGVVCADPGDTVITQYKVDSDYLEYLDGLGYQTKKINFFDVSSEADKSWDSIFSSPLLHEYLQKLEASDEHVVDVYVPTRHDGQLSAKFNLKHCNHYELSEKYGTKSGFRLFMEEADLPHTKGSKDLKSTVEVRDALDKLFNSGYRKTVIKVDDGISGYGNIIVSQSEFVESQLLTDDEFYARYLEPIRWDVIGKGVVEGWIEDGYLSSSILLCVHNKDYEVICLQDQLLVDGDKWAGCYYPSLLDSNPTIKKKLDKMIEKSAQFLIGKGFWGYYSFDVLTTTKGELYLIEANMRKIGSFYPRVLVDKVMGAHGVALDSVNYVASDFTNAKVWAGKSFSVLYDYLKPLLWSSLNRKRGILLYNVGALFDGGKFDFVSVSEDSLEDAKALRDEVMALLEKY